MKIKSSLKNRAGQILDVIYSDINSCSELENKQVRVVHGFCFCKDKLVLVYAKDKGYWAPPGGGVERGETAEEAVIREIKEETNMKVIHHEFIGFQDVYEPEIVSTQTRSFCIVEPYGDFVSDPDGDITEIKLIDPADYKKYFNWGEIGDRIMQRALELKIKPN